MSDAIKLNNNGIIVVSKSNPHANGTKKITAQEPPFDCRELLVLLEKQEKKLELLNEKVSQLVQICTILQEANVFKKSKSTSSK